MARFYWRYATVQASTYLFEDSYLLCPWDKIQMRILPHPLPYRGEPGSTVVDTQSSAFDGQCLNHYASNSVWIKSTM